MNAVLNGVTVFLDRDGTLNDDPGYLLNPEGLVLFPGVPESVARLKQAGGIVVLLTNQSAIGRGLMDVSKLKGIHDKLERVLKEGGGCLDGIFFCPHHPDKQCDCRKPRTGLVRQAMDSLNVQPSRSYMVGDKRSDMELANTVGAVAVLVTTSSVSQQALEARDQGKLTIDYVGTSFPYVVDWILQDASKRKW